MLTRQIDYKYINSNLYDLALICSGYESRSIQVHEKGFEAKHIICFAFKSFCDDEQRLKNDGYYHNAGISLTATDGDQSDSLNAILDAFVKDHIHHSLSVLVDYSCMTRVWYAEILSFFSTLKSNIIKTIDLDFAYSFGKFSPLRENHFRNLHVSPIEGFSAFSIPDKPTALIIGLGYEKNKAFGLAEYFDAETYLFYNVDAESRQFSKEVEKVNYDLMADVPKQNIVQYIIRDIIHTERALSSLCSYLRQNFRVIIAPSGPKPFTLVSLIVALKMGEIDVWRISQGNNRNAIDIAPTGEILGYKVSIDLS